MLLWWRGRQASDVKKAADYVSQLKRVGKGYGTWAFDAQLQERLQGGSSSGDEEANGGRSTRSRAAGLE